MSLLSWDTPPEAMSTQEWQSISADGAPPGVYTPNMSREDMERWKAKYVGASRSKPMRVEIRKSTNGVQILIVVTRHDVRISMNGTAVFTAGGSGELALALAEARQRLDHEHARAAREQEASFE